MDMSPETRAQLDELHAKHDADTERILADHLRADDGAVAYRVDHHDELRRILCALDGETTDTAARRVMTELRAARQTITDLTAR